MARFLGAVQGSRGEATRLGHASSGIRAQAQGWDSGIKVYGRQDGDVDRFAVYATSGSNGGAPDRLIGVLVGGVWFHDVDTAAEDTSFDAAAEDTSFDARDPHYMAEAKKLLAAYDAEHGKWNPDLHVYEKGE